MKATIEIEGDNITVDVITKKSHYQAKGKIALLEDSEDIRNGLEAFAVRTLTKCDNYTSSRASLSK